MAKTANKAPDAAAQFKTRGYVISEDQEYALRDMFTAMEATAFAHDMDTAGANLNYDLTGDQVAAMLRSFARLGRSLLSNAPFTNSATARPRTETEV